MELKRLVKDECSKCGETKPITEFNIRPDRPRGYRSECKKCQYKSQHKNRPPERYKPYNRFHYAKKRGRLVSPQACEGCGKTGLLLQGHHPDYSKPLEVEWLCASCHNRISKKLRTA